MLEFVNTVRKTHNLLTEYNVCITDIKIEKSCGDTEIKLTEKMLKTSLLDSLIFIHIDIKVVL